MRGSGGRLGGDLVPESARDMQADVLGGLGPVQVSAPLPAPLPSYISCPRFTTRPSWMAS